MALSACNAVVNPGFESGILFPWRASAINVAHVSTGANAYSGNYYLNLETAIDNQGNTITQTLKNLKPGRNYTFNAEAQVPLSGSNYCFVYVYAGSNSTVGEIASADVYEESFGKWISVSGTYVPKHPVESLNILAACDSEDNSVTGQVYLDAISLLPQNGCGSV
ncbi:hypothetical protein N7490_004557 [Penicillium lividum]|nr:hypothetical protein N7490_004557 [Penicillium lividum]